MPKHHYDEIQKKHGCHAPFMEYKANEHRVTNNKILVNSFSVVNICHQLTVLSSLHITGHATQFYNNMENKYSKVDIPLNGYECNQDDKLIVEFHVYRI